MCNTCNISHKFLPDHKFPLSSASRTRGFLVPGVCVCMCVHVCAFIPFIHPLVCVCVCVCVRTYTDIHTQMHMHSSRPARWPRRWASKRLHETRRQAGTGGTVLEIRWNQSSRGLGRQFCGAATSQKAPKAPGAAGGMRST